MPQNELQAMKDALKANKKKKEAAAPKPPQRELGPPRTPYLSSLSNGPELKKAKLERMFYQFFDMNKNNVIDWNDFETLTEKIGTLRGEKSREFTIVEEALRVIWKGIVKDIRGLDITSGDDVDTEITLEEWIAMWKRSDPSKKMEKWHWDYLKYLFFLMDTSGDKQIDQTEYESAMDLYGVTPADADFAFKKLAFDAEGNSIDSIDYGQFVELWKEYFSSEDLASKGNFLFGL